MSVRPSLLLLPPALAAALALCLAGCDQAAPPPKVMAMPVDVYTVTTMDIPVVSHLTGRANPTHKAEVRPQVSGILQKRLFEEGSVVEQGQQLYQIDPAMYEANVASAQASLSSAQATLHTNQLKAERYASLLSQKAVSKQEYDDAEAAFLSAKAAVQQARAHLRSEEINLAYTKVYAPINGTISRSNVTEGALVSAQQATALTTIQQLDPIYVDLGQTVESHLDLRQKMATGQLQTRDGKAGVDIYFTNGQKYPYQGTLEFAEVTVNESTGMVNLRAIVPNPDHLLLPSMFLRGDINEGVTPQATVASAEVVQREAAGAAYVYVIDNDNVIHRRDIKLGVQVDKVYEVLDGLAAGERLVASNFQKIRDGAPVQPVDPQAPAPQGAAPAAGK